ncbi:hypothetical protein K2Z84_05165 [Candidatus Binatia bacterium]|nr:hypothetical protein [Candidatus Binatia bacterium]
MIAASPVVKRYEVRCAFAAHGTRGSHRSRFTRFYIWALIHFLFDGCVRQIVDHQRRTVSGHWFAPGDCRYDRREPRDERGRA